MTNENADLIDSLRNVRGAEDIISRLKAGSLEARRERISDALKSESFEHGPAELVATYPKHVVAQREGVLMRISLDESEDAIRFGKVEIYHVPVPATDIGAEILATANAAVDSILAEDMEAVTPMVASIARALDIKGNLQQQIEADVRLRFLTRDAWWQDVVAENFEGEVNLPQPRSLDGVDEKTLLVGSLDDMLSVIRTEAAEATRALKKLAERKDVLPVYVECANDICEDIKSAITALIDVDRDSAEEMQKVYSTVERVAPRLIQGSKFLVQLANNS